MQYFQREKEVEITGVSDFDPERIFECGQCFRFDPDGHGGYTGVAMGRVLRVRRAGDSVYLSGDINDFEKVWRGYFDMDRDYTAIRESLAIDDYMEAATLFGAGIRILRQDRWEALCSFIISQCNNIPRIKKIIERLCRSFGDPVEFEGGTYYTFPGADRLAGLAEKDLDVIGSGYRSPYILNAARAVSGGELDLDALAEADYDTAVRELMKLHGVGKKVANCVILFGLQMLNAFPVDVWIKKAITGQYGNDFDPAVFGEYAGIAQQYIFYYARSGGEIKVG